MKSPAILIIDDESAIRSGVRLSLVDEGWSVDTSVTGTDGLNQALAERMMLSFWISSFLISAEWKY
jgi:DNA-binding response OmpR family regulator